MPVGLGSMSLELISNEHRELFREIESFEFLALGGLLWRPPDRFRAAK